MNKLLTDLSEEGIIQKILGGETALFEIFMRRHNALLYRIGRSYGFCHEDARDLLQEAHIAAYRSLEKFQSRSSYQTWLAKIMVNKCLYKLKYGTHKYEIPQDINDENANPVFTNKPNPHETILNKELSGLLEKSLELLPVPYRTVFVLREVEGFSVNETSALLDLTPVNVKVRLNRAKSMLQQLLEKQYTKAQLYDFHLRYCDEVVMKVMEAVRSEQ